MPFFRVTVPPKLADETDYRRTLDMFEAQYTTAPIDEVDGARVYEVEAVDAAAAVVQIGSMLDRAHLSDWPDYLGQMHAEPL